MSNKYREKVPVPTPKKEAVAAIPPEEWNEEARRKMKPAHIEILEGERCVSFFSERLHLLNTESGFNDVMNTWLNVRAVVRSLDLFELTYAEIDKLEILSLPPQIVARIKEAYKKNMKYKR